MSTGGSAVGGLTADTIRWPEDVSLTLSFLTFVVDSVGLFHSWEKGIEWAELMPQHKHTENTQRYAGLRLCESART